MRATLPSRYIPIGTTSGHCGVCAVYVARAWAGSSRRAWDALGTRFASSLFASIEATRAQRKWQFIQQHRVGGLRPGGDDLERDLPVDVPEGLNRGPSSAHSRRVSRRLAQQAQARCGVPELHAL